MAHAARRGQPRGRIRYASLAKRQAAEEEAVAAMLRSNPGATTNEIRERMGWGASRTKARLEALERARVLERDTSHPPYHHWFRRGAKGTHWLAEYHLDDPELLRLWKTLDLHPGHEAGYYADVMQWHPRTAWHWLIEFKKAGLAKAEERSDEPFIPRWSAARPDGLRVT